MPATVTHWRSLYEMDRDFYELCCQRVAESYEESYVDSEDAPVQIYAAFGFMDALLTLDQVDDEAIHLFGRGACSFFAIALHEATGLPLAVFTSPEAQDSDYLDWSGHAAVALPGGRFLDIYGVMSAEEINARYRFSEPVAPAILGWGDYLELQFGSKDVADPYRSLDPLEIRLLRHFAEFIARSAGLRVQQD